MKNFFVLFVCITFSSSIFAQQHLTFKGVPIDGSLQQYTNAMINAGFHYEGSQDGVSILSGDFAGYKKCIIGVSTIRNYDIVSKISVIFPDKDTWSSVLNNYETLRRMLTEKYGTPYDVREKFTGYIGDYDNYLVMNALKEEKYEWYTTFSTYLGEIELSIISGLEYGTAAVRLTYIDKENSDKVHNAAMDDL